LSRSGQDLTQRTDEAVKKTMESFSGLVLKSSEDRSAAYAKQVADLDAHVQAKLDQLSTTVEQTLQQKLSERLETTVSVISKDLQQVQQGLGEMRTLAGSVGDLKRILGSVKNRGMLGEVQLGAILDSVLPPSLLERDARIQDRNVVEFAVRVPVQGGESLLLPIDSKFPGDAYRHLQDAMETGDETAIKAAQKTLCSRIVDESKDISGKYLVPGRTTDFGILFLPFEGLYATAVDLGLSETVQQWHVVLAGPSTLLAILNCVLMMNRFLTVQEQSKRLFTVVQRLQKEFENYHSAMSNLRTHFQRVGDDLDKLTATRWNKLQKCFGELEQLKPPDGTTPGGTTADAAATGSTDSGAMPPDGNDPAQPPLS
jgi:DNA recombination protein RmuC